MSTTQSQQLLTAESSLRIFNSRSPITRAHVGNQVEVVIASEGTRHSAAQARAADLKVGKPERSQYFDTIIYNVAANSQLAIASPEIRAIRKQALIAESQGDTEKAHLLFREWLNKTQISFNIIDNGRQNAVFFKGQVVLANVEEVTSQAGNVSLTLRNIVAKPALKLSKSAFTEADLIDDDLPTGGSEAPATPAPVEQPAITAESLSAEVGMNPFGDDEALA